MIARGRSISRGSIPACAGEPVLGVLVVQQRKVYPRVCGGTRSGRLIRTFVFGLSPRVRGNRLPEYPLASRFGSIPACAGEPIACSWCQDDSAVYPRVCGGTGTQPEETYLYYGLSPRVRGNQSLYLHREAGRRSIPACAGEPPSQTISLRPSSVYPRVCGGTVTLSTAVLTISGLSPRVRGNLMAAASLSIAPRSIPACAGEPDTPRPSERPDWVYPRVCGGTVDKTSPQYNLSGLSPRVRGNPFV